MKRVRCAVKAVIIVDGRLLVTANEDRQGEFFLLPGGGQEYGESMHGALIRECREELGAEVEPGRLICVRDYIGAHHEFADEGDDSHQVEFMFAARLAAGSEPRYDLRSDPEQTGCTWLELAELHERRLYPLSLRRALQRGLADLLDPYLGDVN